MLCVFVCERLTLLVIQWSYCLCPTVCQCHLGQRYHWVCDVTDSPVLGWRESSLRTILSDDTGNFNFCLKTNAIVFMFLYINWIRGHTVGHLCPCRLCVCTHLVVVERVPGCALYPRETGPGYFYSAFKNVWYRYLHHHPQHGTVVYIFIKAERGS